MFHVASLSQQQKIRLDTDDYYWQESVRNVQGAYVVDARFAVIRHGPIIPGDKFNVKYGEAGAGSPASKDNVSQPQPKSQVYDIPVRYTGENDQTYVVGFNDDGKPTSGQADIGASRHWGKPTLGQAHIGAKKLIGAICGLRSTALLLGVLLALITGRPCGAASDEASQCVTRAGNCRIQQVTAPTCRCDTQLGGIAGTPKPVSDPDMTSLPTARIKGMTGIDSDDLNIQVFAKKTDSAVIDDWLKALNPKIKRTHGEANPAVANDDTNGIFFSEDAVRIVAISLIQRKLKIASIQLYYPDAARNLPVRHDLIQIGASRANRSRDPLSLDQVAKAALPMLGDRTAKP